MSNKKTKVGKFLSSIGKPLEVVTGIVGDITGIKILNDISSAISGNKELTEEEKEIALALIESDKKDIADARSLQKKALDQDDLFSKRFLYYFASFWSAITAFIVIIIMFVEIPENNIRLVDTVFGFLLGTVLAGMFTYFFGSSAGSDMKDKFIEKFKTKTK